jgi:hypothetical protein
MAQIVAGIGTSHTPLLVINGKMWEERAATEKRSKNLIDMDGEVRTYDELERQVKARYADIANVPRFNEQYEASQRALDHLAAEIDAINPDVVIIIGDDQEELFGFDNLPALSVFYGDKVANIVRHRGASAPQWQIEVAKNRGMDAPHEYPGSPELARHIIAELVDSGIDVATVDQVTDPDKHGFGHAITFPIVRLMRNKKYPVVPVLLNTYFPPNQPTPSRCLEIGRALRRAIESYPANMRVLLLASGGLSHMVTHEPLDHQVLEALRDGDEDTLSRLPLKLLESGTSEIRNWIVMAGAMRGMKMKWSEYIPVYRTPAGTGIGMGFATFGA